MVEEGNFVVVDTETTGLAYPAEACEIAVIDSKGKILFDSLVKPSIPISKDAERIHGITLRRVKSKPTFAAHSGVLESILEGKNIVSYGAKFDKDILCWSSEPHGIKTNWGNIGSWWCAMNWYARVWGQPHPVYGTPKWQKLANAVQQQGLTVKDAHNALGDCRMTLKLIQRVASSKPNTYRDF